MNQDASQLILIVFELGFSHFCGGWSVHLWCSTRPALLCSSKGMRISSTTTIGVGFFASKAAFHLVFHMCQHVIRHRVHLVSRTLAWIPGSILHILSHYTMVDCCVMSCLMPRISNHISSVHLHPKAIRSLVYTSRIPGNRDQRSFLVGADYGW